MAIPEFLAPAAIGGFLKRTWPFILAGVVALVLLLTYCEGKRSGTAESDLERERGNVETLKKKGAADESAAGARLTDAERRAHEQAELERTVANETDPRERRRAFHRCLGLQQRARAAGDPAPVCE